MKSRAVSILLTAVLLLLTGCSGGGQTAPDAQEAPDASFAGGKASAIISEPSGFTEEMVTACGFFLGSQTADDIIAIYGQPQSVTESSYSTRLDYPFGAFELDSTLYYVLGYSGLTGPQGIKTGDSIEEVADKLCAGSSAKLGTADEVTLYDNGNGNTGTYTRLTAEFVGETGVYQLDYTTACEKGKIKLTVLFDKESRMTAFTIQLL